MMPSNNPTAVSSVMGEEFETGTAGSTGELLKNLAMPAITAAFATYLLIGLFTMRVPEGTVFPGPKFFPGIITAGLYLFAILLAVGAVRKHRAGADALVPADVEGPTDDPDAEGPEGSLLLTDEGAEPASSSGAVHWPSLAWIVGAFIGFALLLTVLGWIIAAALLFWCVARGFGSERVLGNLVVGLTVASLSYILFGMLLGLSLPSGILGWGF